MRSRLLRLLTAACFAGGLWLPAAALAAVIGQWSGSARSWNSPQMSIVRATLSSAGHVVLADNVITAANLAGVEVYVIAEPTLGVSAAEAIALADYVQRGGLLVVLGDTGNNTSFLNGVLAAAGSALSYSGGGATNAPIVSGVFAADGPPFGLVGQSLTVTTGIGVAGGAEVAGSYLRYQRLGAGTVFAIGDRLDHDSLQPTVSSVNGRLFLNIAARGALASGAPVPALSPLALLALVAGLALASVRLLRRR